MTYMSCDRIIVYVISAPVNSLMFRLLFFITAVCLCAIIIHGLFLRSLLLRDRLVCTPSTALKERIKQISYGTRNRPKILTKLFMFAGKTNIIPPARRRMAESSNTHSVTRMQRKMETHCQEIRENTGAPL